MHQPTRMILRYYLSFIPLLLIFFSSQSQFAIVLIILPFFLPFFGSFYRPLRFYDGLAASFGWVFLSFLLSFEIITLLSINLIVFWSIFGLFVHIKELQVRQLERLSLLVNYQGDKKPLQDWAYMPLDKIQIWATMVEGTRYRPFPVRLILYKDPTFRLQNGFYYDTWYEAIVLLNQDLLNKLPPRAQTALAAKQFAHLLQKDSDNQKILIFWIGLLISWSFGSLSIIDEFTIIDNELVIQGILSGFSIILGFIILIYQMRQQEFQADLRAADLCDALDDVYLIYQSIIGDTISKENSKIVHILKKKVNKLLKANPTPEERMKHIKKNALEITTYDQLNKI